MIYIERYREERIWKHTGPWRLVYGRRKTGKSFFVKEFTEWDEYYYVKRDGSAVDMKNMESLDKKHFIREFFREVGEKRIVVDEFHRLGEGFLDMLHATGRKGELTLITSSKFMAKRLLGDGSPILGLVTPFPMGLISPLDILVNIRDLLSGKELVDAGVFVREPWLIHILEKEGWLTSLVLEIRNVEGLMGEIFTEEDRKLTEVYDAVLRAVADGKNTLGEITSFLHSRGVIKTGNTGYVAPYLRVLEAMDVLGFWKKGKKRIYYHRSPVLDLYYYCVEKYGEPGEGTVKRAMEAKLGLYVEDFAREFFSELWGLKGEKGFDPEADGVFYEYKRPVAVMEVKWKDRISTGEIREIEEKLSGLDVERKILVVPEKSVLEGETELEVWDVERMVREPERKIREGSETRGS